MEGKQKRLFFGLEALAPWPENYPQGRLLKPKDRHLTLAFLGNTDFPKLEKALSSFPSPPFTLGFTGIFDQCLFLPSRDPRVVAWNILWNEKSDLLEGYYHDLIEWLKSHGFSPVTKHGFTPHATLCRAPFNKRVWEKSFSPLPFSTGSLHLYESLGHSTYQKIWSYSLSPPFEEIEHTADLAFLVRGKDFSTLLAHAETALAFLFPPLIQFREGRKPTSLDEVIITLNEQISHADKEIGTPIKAVSFSSQLEEKDAIFTWEMILDV
ncbi:MAG: RNA 2',3'-cyclic phosphodiesterase [Chlamydiae bacterium]|nr:RNA 2',3'-cyclic phosphodiesterase [Chlamydiota bacterium]